MSAKANFGIDAPGVIRNLALAALASAVLGIAARVVPALHRFGGIALDVAIIFAVQALLMLWTSLRGKRFAAKALIDRADLRGGEQVLDVGCGRGLLLIETAHPWVHGRAPQAGESAPDVPADPVRRSDRPGSGLISGHHGQVPRRRGDAVGLPKLRFLTCVASRRPGRPPVAVARGKSRDRLREGGPRIRPA